MILMLIMIKYCYTYPYKNCVWVYTLSLQQIGHWDYFYYLTGYSFVNEHSAFKN